jgi:hypothetical protein
MNEQNGVRLLPIKCPPPSLIFGHIITPMSIILGHEGTEDWFYSNYIQLCAPSKCYIYGEKDVEFLNFYPKYYSDFESFYLRTHNINEKILELNSGNLIDYLIKWINSGYYIETFLNESEIKGTFLCEKKIIRINEQMIFGYDLNKLVFKMTVFNERDQFDQIDVPFEDITRIFFSVTNKKLCKESDWLSVGDEYGLVLYKFRDDISYTLNIESIVMQLDEYVKGKNSAIHFNWLNQEKMDFVFGMKVYDSLENWLGLYSSEYVDNRSLFGLWDHKKIMKYRLIYLEKKGYLNKSKEYAIQYEKVESIADNLRLLNMKYNIVRKKEVLSSIINSLKIMKEVEYKILTQVLVELNANQLKS